FRVGGHHLPTRTVIDHKGTRASGVGVDIDDNIVTGADGGCTRRTGIDTDVAGGIHVDGGGIDIERGRVDIGGCTCIADIGGAGWRIDVGGAIVGGTPALVADTVGSGETIHIDVARHIKVIADSHSAGVIANSPVDIEIAVDIDVVEGEIAGAVDIRSSDGAVDDFRGTDGIVLHVGKDNGIVLQFVVADGVSSKVISSQGIVLNIGTSERAVLNVCAGQ